MSIRPLLASCPLLFVVACAGPQPTTGTPPGEKQTTATQTTDVTPATTTDTQQSNTKVTDLGVPEPVDAWVVLRGHAEVAGVDVARVETDPDTTTVSLKFILHAGDPVELELGPATDIGIVGVFDLAAEGESRDVSAEHPKVHAELVAALAAWDAPTPHRAQERTDDDLEALRALGYVE